MSGLAHRCCVCVCICGQWFTALISSTHHPTHASIYLSLYTCIYQSLSSLSADQHITLFAFFFSSQHQPITVNITNKSSELALISPSITTTSSLLEHRHIHKLCQPNTALSALSAVLSAQQLISLLSFLNSYLSTQYAEQILVVAAVANLYEQYPF